jgi:hypothetical protein
VNMFMDVCVAIILHMVMLLRDFGPYRIIFTDVPLIL